MNYSYYNKRDSRSESPLKTTSLSYSFKRISSPTQKYPLELDEEEDPMNINYNRFKTQINDLDYHDYHSHSIRQSHLPYHMDLPIHDISDHESTDDDNETIRAYSPTLTPDDLYSSPNSNLDDIPHPPTRNHTPSNYSSYYSQPNFSQPPSESFESISKENPLLQSATESKSGIKDNISVDDLNSSVKSLHTVHDAKTAGYAIIFTLISFIGIHIIPIVELFPILLRSRMGSIVSSLVLFALSICIGYQVSISRVSYIRFYRQLKTHRTFLSCRSLVVLLISLYLTSYTTPFIFRWVYHIHFRIPILGGVLIGFSLVWVILLTSVMSFWTMGRFSWSLTHWFYQVLKSNSKSFQSNTNLALNESQSNPLNHNKIVQKRTIRIHQPLDDDLIL